MSLTSGFFNSVNGDRRYNAEQMSSIFDGLLTDGVYASIGDLFAVTPDTGMFINVGTGRAWFNKTWVYNDSPLSIELTALSPASLGRNDLIVLKVDHSNAVRACEFITVIGTPASTPVDPDMPENDTVNGIYYYKFAKVAIPATTTTITAAMITNYIGVTPGVPFATGLMQVQDLSLIYNQLNAEFMDWWNNVIIPVLDEETVTLLTNRINALDVLVQPLNKYRWMKTKVTPDVAAYIDFEHGTALTDKRVYTRPDSGSAYRVYGGSSEQFEVVLYNGNLNVHCTNTGYIYIYQDASSTKNNIKGRYFVLNSGYQTEGFSMIGTGEYSTVGVVYFPEDVVVSVVSGQLIADRCVVYPLVQNPGEIETVESSNRNAYPDSGVVGDYAYTYIGSNIDSLASMDSVITIYGESYIDVTIDIGRIPKNVIVMSPRMLRISNLKNDTMLKIASSTSASLIVSYSNTDILVLTGTEFKVPLDIATGSIKYTIICIG